MAQDQQPEEAATKPLAAAASAAGSFTQTQMYGRGFRQRPDATKAATEPAAETEPPVALAEMVVACSAQDAAAAQARLQHSQLPAPPSAAPPVPGLARGL